MTRCCRGAADLHLPLTWDRNGPSAEKTIDDAYDLSNVAKNGNAVIVHRAGAVELANQEDVARVGIFADWDDRVVRVMHREGLSNVAQAERIIADREEAQKEYFYQLHRADPEDPDIYDFVINTLGQKHRHRHHRGFALRKGRARPSGGLETNLYQSLA